MPSIMVQGQTWTTLVPKRSPGFPPKNLYFSITHQQFVRCKLTLYPRCLQIPIFELDPAELFIAMASVVHPSWVRTPMIRELSSNPNFKDNIIELENVAKAIAHQLFSGLGIQITLPESVGWVSIVPGFPL